MVRPFAAPLNAGVRRFNNDRVAKGNKPRPDTDKFAVNLNVYLRLSSKGEARILKRLDLSL